MSVADPDPADRVVAVDLGGTKTAVALVDRAGGLGPVLTRATPAQQGPERVVAAIAEAVRDVTADRPPAVAVGVGAAGVIDSTTGTVLSATDAITGWTGTELADLLGTALGLPVAVDNDVNAHAAGEAWLGAGRDASAMLMVAVGTGVGGAVVLGGQPLHGAHHVSGEIGHVPVRGAEHLRCGCGRTGHLEALASGPGLLRHYLSLGGDPEVSDTRDVVGLATSADLLARRAVRESAGGLGVAMAGFATLLDPDVIVVGGGLAEAGPVWWEPMEQAMRAELVDVLVDVPLRRAELGTDAALVGAAHRAWARVSPEQAEDPV